MIDEQSRKILILSCQHEVAQVKRKYREGKVTLETLQAVHRAMEALQVQVQIEAKK